MYRDNLQASAKVIYTVGQLSILNNNTFEDNYKLQNQEQLHVRIYLRKQAGKLFKRQLRGKKKKTLTHFQPNRS